MTIIAGIKIPDSAMARAATVLIRDTESELLFRQRFTPTSNRPATRFVSNIRQ
jgi:hypothetical protein